MRAEGPGSLLGARIWGKDEKGVVGKEIETHNMQVLEDLEARPKPAMEKRENGGEKKAWKMMRRLKCSFGCSPSPLPCFSSRSHWPGSEGKPQQLISSSLILYYVGGGGDTYAHNIHINTLIN